MKDISDILTKKDYGHRSLRANDRIRKELAGAGGIDFEYPSWLAAAFIAVIALSCVGEDKQLNLRFGGLPKAISLLVIAMAFLTLLLKGNLRRFKYIGVTSILYIVYWGLLCLWSAILWVINFSDNSAITRGVEKMLFQTIAVIVAIAAVYIFGARTIDFFAIGIYIANGMIALIEMPSYGGPVASLTSLFDMIIHLGDGYGYSLALEIHEVTFLYGMFLVYYLVFAPRETEAQKRMNRWQIVLSYIFLFTGFKRLLILCIPLVAFLAHFIRKRKKPFLYVMAIGVFWVVFYFVFLYIVYNGVLLKVAESFGVNMMGRDYIWELAKRYYRFSPTYMGLGFGTVDAVIVAGFYELGLIDKAYPLHNDVLKVFIEFGFPGLVIWSGVQYIVFPIVFKKLFDTDTAVMYMATMTLMSTTYLTDNTAFYFWCMMGLRLLPLAYGIYRKNLTGSQIKEEKAVWNPPSRADIKQLVSEKLAEKGEPR